MGGSVSLVDGHIDGMTPQEALEILYKGIAPNPTVNNECIKLCKKALENQQKISMDRYFEVKELKSAINGFRGYEDKIKAEAYKEFANELKCRTHEISYNTMQVVNKDDIDNLLKELVGDK